MDDVVQVISQKMLSNYGTDGSGVSGTAGINIKLKRDSSGKWELDNPTPKQGEPCAELLSDGRVRLKIGDGITQWNNLPYAVCGVDDGELN